MGNKQRFNGFPEGETDHIIIPPDYFVNYLPLVDDLDELKLNLIILWISSQSEKLLLLFSLENLTADPNIFNIFNRDQSRIQNALEKSVKRESLLIIFEEKTNKTLYFLNTPFNKIIFEEIKAEKISLADFSSNELVSMNHPSNIFRLYEENLGILTPMITEILKEDESEFPAHWIREAIQIAVQHNARNWKYVHAILVSWKNEGKNGKDKKNTQRTRDQYREKWLGRNAKK